jgi:hypothetical protein
MKECLIATVENTSSNEKDRTQRKKPIIGMKTMAVRVKKS